MAKRRGTEEITTASLGVCATSYRHKNLLFSQLDRSQLNISDATHSHRKVDNET